MDGVAEQRHPAAAPDPPRWTIDYVIAQNRVGGRRFDKGPKLNPPVGNMGPDVGASVL